MGSTDEPNRFQHTRVLGVDDVVANTGEGGVAAMGRTAGWGCCGGDDGGFCVRSFIDSPFLTLSSGRATLETLAYPLLLTKAITEI